MRITSSSNYGSILNDLQSISQRMQVAQNEISSGKKLNRPSDDPSAAADVVNINSEQSQTAQYLNNIDTGNTRLQTADSTLQSVQQVVASIQSVALASTRDASTIPAAATTLSGLRDQIVSAANTAYDGQYIFGGSQTQSAPYVKQSDGTVTYAGNSDAVSLQIGQSSTLQTQIPGSEIFSGSVDIFSTVNNLITAVNNSDTAGINSAVNQLQQFQSNLSNGQSRVGSLMNAATAAKTQLQQTNLAQTANLSRLQDADLAQALTDFTQNQTALQAATQVAGRVSNISILDYLTT